MRKSLLLLILLLGSITAFAQPFDTTWYLLDTPCISIDHQIYQDIQVGNFSYKDTSFLVENLGTDTLQVTVSTFALWIGLTCNSNFSIPAGGDPVEVCIRFDGTLYFDTVLNDSIIVTSNDSSGNERIVIPVKGFVITDEEYYFPQFFTTQNSSIRLKQSNIGCIADRDTIDGMFSLLDQAYYLYDGCFFLATINSNGDTLVSRDIFSNQFTHAASDLTIDTLDLGEYSIIRSKVKFLPFFPDLGAPWPGWWWGLEISTENMMFLGEDSPVPENVVISKMDIYPSNPPIWWPSGSPPDLGDLYLGMILDWDVPADSVKINNGGFKDSYYLSWQSGTGTMANFYAGISFLDNISPYSANIVDNQTYVYPNSGFLDGELYQIVAASGDSVYDDTTDLTSVITAKHLESLTDTLTIKFAFAATSDSLIDLLNDINKARVHSGVLSGAQPTDVNGDGIAISIADFLYLYEYLFFHGPEPVFWGSADIDSIAGVNIGDVVRFNEYFIYGPEVGIYRPPFPDLPPETLTTDTLYAVYDSSQDAYRHSFDLKLTNSQYIRGWTIPLSFSIAEGTIVCDSVSFTGTRLENIGVGESTIDTVEQQILIWYNYDDRDNALTAGSGAIAKLYFTISDSLGEWGISFDTTFIEPTNELLMVQGQYQYPPSAKSMVVPQFEHRFANFVGEPKAGYWPLLVQFNDMSSGNPLSWEWDFGDGNIDSVKNPLHTYNDTGYFDVKLTVYYTDFSQTITKLNYITVYDTLSVDFMAEPYYGHKPLTVSFQHLCSITPESVMWHFGDGDSSGELNAVHQYTEAGIYDVKLVAELFDYTDSLTKEDYVWISDIQAQFAADKRCGNPPLEISFSDSSTGIFPATNWHWDFGDGGTSDEQNPTYQFEEPGAFDITLIVSDGIGTDTLVKENYVIAQDSVFADFFGLPNSGKSPLTVMFESVFEGIANKYHWDFGDGDTSDLRNPIHIYTSQGKFSVKLLVKLELDDCNQIDSVIKEDFVVVNDLMAKFSANPNIGVPPLTVQFTDESSGNPDTWYWDFGDEHTSTEKNPSHQYDTVGAYDVFLRVSNAFFSDSLLKLNNVHVDTAFPADLLCRYFYFGESRPGFDAWLLPIWENIGTDPADECTMWVLLPSEVNLESLECIALGSGTCSPYSFLGDTIVVPLSTINPTIDIGGGLSIRVNISESVALGDTLIWEVWLTTTTSEPNYMNNYFKLMVEVTGSIDPNDKLAYPGGEELSYEIKPEDRLTYTIRFENKPEATADAIYIRVVDTLDQNLDWGTLASGFMSHTDECDYEFDPYNGVITWFCDSIMLPPNENPPEGEGYFTFSISPKKNLPQGTEISNTAWIRFDYNEWLQAPEEGAVIRTIKTFLCGDVNDDESINLSDPICLASYYFGKPCEIDPWASDVNCDAGANLGDAIIIANVYFGKPGFELNCCP